MDDPSLGAGTRQRRRMPRARALLAAAVAAVCVAVAVALAAGVLDSGKTASPRDRQGASLRRCVALWNGPANAKQRSTLSQAAIASAGGTTTSSGATPVAERVLVLR